MEQYTLLYQAVWSHSAGLGGGGNGPAIMIPETVVFEGGGRVARDWFFTHRRASSSDTGSVEDAASEGNSPPSGIYRKRVSSNEEILRQLLSVKLDSNRESGGIVANMVWFDGDRKLCIRYLTAQDLQTVLLGDAAADGSCPYPDSTWILQAFVTPDYECSMNTIISTPVAAVGGGGDNADDGGVQFYPTVLVNKNKFQSANIASMALDPEHINVVERFSSHSLKNCIEFQCRLTDACLRALLPPEQCSEFSYYFRFIESTGLLFFLWGQELPPSSRSAAQRRHSQQTNSSRPTITPLSSRSDAASRGNERLMKEVLASYEQGVGKKPTTASSHHHQQQQQQQQQQRQQQRPDSSGGGAGKAPGVKKSKTRKAVIATLYLKPSKPVRRGKTGDGMELPPWQEINSVKYSLPEEQVDRYEQIKKTYSVRNVGYADDHHNHQTRSVHSQPHTPAMPAPSQSFSRPVTSQSQGRPSAGAAAAASTSNSAAFQTGRSAAFTDELSLDELVDGPDLFANLPRGEISVSTPSPTAAAAAAHQAAALTPRVANAGNALSGAAELSSPANPKASKALRHAEQFGRQGRMARKARREEAADLGSIIAPPGSSEDMIDYTTAVIMKVCDKLGQYLIEALEFADEHRDAVGDYFRKRENLFGDDATREVRTLTSVGSGLKKSKERLPPGSSEVQQQQQQDDNDASLLLGTQPAVDTILARLGYKRDAGVTKVAAQEDDDIDEEAEADYQDDDVGLPARGEDGISLTWSQTRFLKVLELLICVPNHRPADQLSTILLWILSCPSADTAPETDGRLHDDIISLKSMLRGFSKFSYNVRNLLADVSDNQSQRSAGKDPTAQKTIDAAVFLRAWIVDKYQVIRAPVPLAPETAADGEDEDYNHVGSQFDGGGSRLAGSPADGSYSPSSSSVKKQTAAVSAVASVLGLAAARADDSGANAPKKPHFTGPVQRLGRSAGMQLAGGGYVSADGTVVTSAADSAAAASEFTRRVKAHVGMEAFLSAIRWPRPELVDAPKKNTAFRQSLSTSVTPPVLASFSAFPDEAAELDGPSLPFAAARGPVHRELSFFQMAPKLTAEQRTLLFTSFVVDMAQTIILNLSVLCRHASAGKEIVHEDLVALFGAPTIRIIGAPLVTRLLAWLHSNRRSNSVFKRSNPALVDMGKCFLRPLLLRVGAPLTNSSIPPALTH